MINVVPDLRSCLAVLLCRVAHLSERELCDSLSPQELADLEVVTADAVATAAAFNAAHPEERPITGDEAARLVDARSEVLRRLRTLNPHYKVPR